MSHRGKCWKFFFEDDQMEGVEEQLQVLFEIQSELPGDHYGLLYYLALIGIIWKNSNSLYRTRVHSEE